MTDAIAHGLTRRAALAGLGAALATTACSRRRSRALSFWAIGREGEMAAQLLEEFQREHPEMEVDVQKLPWNGAHEKLLTAFAGDTLPDLCQLGSTWVPELAALDALEPLDPYVTSSSVPTSDYFAGSLEANRVDGKLLGLPWYADTRLLFYRRDLLQQAGFAAPPVTWDEWSRMLAAIKAMVGRERYSVLLPLNEFEPLLVLALQQPEELLRDGGRWGNFRGAGFKRALSYYQQMFEREWAPRMTNTQISNVWDEFARGYFSFYISGPWQLAEFKKRMPPQLQSSWMTASMPGPEGPGVSGAGGASLVIFRQSPHKEAAWRLVEFLSSVPTQIRFYELTGDLPTRRAAWEVPALAQSPHARAFRQQLDRLRAPPKVPEWERIGTELRLAAERVVQRVVDVDTAAAQLDAKVDDILAKRRWLLARKDSA